MDLVCINDIYPVDALEFFNKNGVDYPKKDTLYSLRDIQKHTNGKIGIRVNEIINPIVLVKHYILKEISVEPTFDHKRFATLEKKVLTKEILEQIEYEVEK
jgi:hypothetical protein